MNRIRFTRVRDVKTPSRANSGDAGLDFYFPFDLKRDQITGTGYRSVVDSNWIIHSILLEPHARVLIPSGIRVLIEPKDSMLTAANKSGLASKSGLVFTAQIVDSPYTGEVHIGILNTGEDIIKLKSGEKLTQFIHVPIYLSEPEEISQNEYEEISKTWGTRGSGGFGSSDKKE